VSILGLPIALPPPHPEREHNAKTKQAKPKYIFIKNTVQCMARAPKPNVVVVTMKKPCGELLMYRPA
jgi:hypothetical protein